MKSNVQEKAETHTFSFSGDNRKILYIIKQKAKENDRNISTELCRDLKKLYEAEGLI